MVIQRGKLKDFPLFNMLTLFNSYETAIYVQFKYIYMINNSRAVIYEIFFYYSKWYIYVLFCIVFLEGTENICLQKMFLPLCII